ncbi:MAG: hypothetical protein HXY41_14170 [Chloroflexi bacterium]|nr:hypothetical protein [Chloroflexota bacterium]
MNTLPKLLKVIVLIILCLTLTLPVFAQEETAEPVLETTETVEAIPGLPSLVLLTGLLAISAVGFFIIARENYRETPDEP